MGAGLKGIAGRIGGRATLAVAAAGLLAFARCQSGAPPLPPAPPIDYLTVNQLSGPGIDEPLPRATQAQLPGDPQRLGDDVQRTAKQLEWGMLSISDTIRKSDGSATPPGPAVVRARALLPDGRAATLVAWPIEPATYDEKGKKLLKPGRVAVALRVGFFGDRQNQERFIRRLSRVMAGDPKPVRGWGFTLPPVEGQGESTKAAP